VSGAREESRIPLEDVGKDRDSSRGSHARELQSKRSSKTGTVTMICRSQIVEEATRSDAESVVGDECHIVSGQSQGPRYDASFPAARLDEPDNLILLCRVHHKMVDDQTQT
jgi:hypothetical protein